MRWKSLVIVVFLVGCQGALTVSAGPFTLFTGPTSPYYLDGGRIWVVQGDHLAFSFPFTYGQDEGVIAVSQTVRTRTSDLSTDFGGEYTPSGVPTGSSYTSGGYRVYDGTSDGVSNYFVDHFGGVVKTDYYWQNPAFMFNPDWICNQNEPPCHGLSGIAYDSGDKSLWIAGKGSRRVGEYSLSGQLLRWFDASFDRFDPAINVQENAALAFDPADGTLWMTTTGLLIGSGYFYLRQFSRDGMELQAGIPSGLPPGFFVEAGEFAIVVPELSTAFLALTGVLLAVRALRKRA